MRNTQSLTSRGKDNKKLQGMAYNKINKLIYYQKIQNLTKEHYEPGFITMVGVWKKYIYPTYPISYSHFRKILEEPRLRERIEQEEDKK